MFALSPDHLSILFLFTTGTAGNTDLPSCSVISHKLINVQMLPLNPQLLGSTETQSFAMLIALLDQGCIAGPADAIFPKDNPSYRHSAAICCHIQLPIRANNLHKHYRIISCSLSGNKSGWPGRAGAARNFEEAASCSF